MSKVNIDCKHFRGHIPCKPHKATGVHCPECKQYEPLKERILIIKLGAVGDVIRTTPLLRRLRQDFPQAEISWLSYTPPVVPMDWVDNALDMSLQNILWLGAQQLDWVINLDKDKEAVALADKLRAERKSGFIMGKYGKCVSDKGRSEHDKWVTGLWDDANQANTQNYMQEIFSICGYTFNDERYILNIEQRAFPQVDHRKIVVGLNTGCGERWPTRLWPDRYWAELSETLSKKGYEVILLGGPQEDEKNRKLAAQSGAKYLGTFPFGEFYSLIDQCDIVVSQVTMAMHVAIARDKYLVLLNNIFNRNEFYLYGKGTILQPDLPCLGCFKQRFDSNCKSSNCMELIAVSQVLQAIEPYRR